MMIDRFAIGFLFILTLSACSNHWTASIEMKDPEHELNTFLTVKLSSSLGDQFEGKIDNNCIDVHIRQSSKLPNKIRSIWGQTRHIIGQ